MINGFYASLNFTCAIIGTLEENIYEKNELLAL